MAFQKNLRTRTIKTVLDFMSATLYTDAIEIIQNAETVRRQIGIVNTRQEERLARTAVLLLAFAFAHGMNGLRQVADDYIHRESLRRAVSWVIIIAWAVITAIGAMAIITFTGSKVGPLG